MRTFFTALAFVIILLAILPALKRSLYPAGKRPRGDHSDNGVSRAGDGKPEARLAARSQTPNPSFA